MRLCVIIPVHNESKEIGTIVREVKAKGMDVIVIDDGSTDQSDKAARDSGAVVLVNQHKTGKGLSLQRGFGYALLNHYDGVIAMDGDGQHDAGDLDQFRKKINECPLSVITGTRMENPKGMPLIRYMTNLLMSKLISIICKRHIPDSQCGFRYIHCEILNRLQLISHDFEIETEVLIKTNRLGYPIFSVPIKTIYRDEKSKISPIRDTIRFFAYLLKEIRAKAS